MGDVRAGRLSRVEPVLIRLVAAHSVAVGLGLMLFTDWGARLGGWPRVEPHFFARQAGVFHLVAAFGYLLEWERHRGVTFLVVTKATAFVFLLGGWLLAGEPWIVPASAAADGAMGLAVALVHRRARR